MKKSRFTEEQIIGFIKQAEAGLPIKALYRKGGFSGATFYKWRAKFDGLMLELGTVFLALHSQTSLGLKKSLLRGVRGNGVEANSVRTIED